MSVLSVENLTVSFRSGTAVRNVSFAVEAGRTLGIVGESGSGKSVSLLAATGLLGSGAVVQGRALHHGTDLVTATPKQLRALRGRDIGFVFQDPLSNLHPLMPVGRQIGEAITAHRRVDRATLRRRVVELLDEVGIARARDRIDDYPVHFSGGMRQRVMIAIAIANDPQLVIADEPTTALDATVQSAILGLLQRLRQDHHMALVLVSHDLALVSDVADDVVVMHRGQVVEAGPADRVYTAPAHRYTEALLAARHRPVAPPVGARPHRAELLRAENVSKSFRTGGRRRHQVLADVDLCIGEGEIVGLVGESGSGKSTLSRIVAGLETADSGILHFRGSPYVRPGRQRVAVEPHVRRSIQMVFQDPYGSLNPRRSISEILTAPFELAGEFTPVEIRRRIGELLARVGLPGGFTARYPAQLSGGQRQRVALARALALDPALIVADEPVSALDMSTARQIVDLLRALRDEQGTSLLFVSHDLGVVSALCDRVAVLRDGMIVEQGYTDEIFAAPRHEYTRTLLSAVPGHARRDTVDA
ncbi:dipeptide ABC transporter ATP-binding protein [Rhodococcus aetherivorans]|jgi:peptide/nickel transport system ATP-binding protein|uniref:ABC transporter ATP-binding protein n=3 Tax=Rhodococcus TaxID=1827 RepID=A0AA46SAX6_9NOCA|nr:ABC transporter ATP-binding protein [Rhodococcus aetherivorans]NCL78339.1 Glutathione import ATP-binding protein GsiA [Rhodococcus sp. YH1]UGQ42533.1 ABC transporter ATP-binding protein [Rhodococcus aetherivorans]UYF95720.1 ABC transporter ATP-binding protein [Rhodococcus aetherivorans]WFS15650.1 ABC transporter ATP-binding protein [Rhodococcus aetherivorans]WKW97540.1 ABC transporter ATP-binding protein [Rhodococcus aetherivorans]